MPQVFYLTRTHSQIAQIVEELKQSPYKPRAVVLASKTHYCINEAVRQQQGGVEEGCEHKLEHGGCEHKSDAVLELANMMQDQARPVQALWPGYLIGM